MGHFAPSARRLRFSATAHCRREASGFPTPCRTKVPYRTYRATTTLAGVSDARRLIAVVDDEPSVCRALERLLRAAKFDVATFCSGAEFLASLRTRRPDCLVLDLHMPEMNGFEVQARLAADPAGAIGVVAITAHDSIESKERALAGGAQAYLRKPVDDQPLLQAIRDVIARCARPPLPSTSALEEP